MITKRQVANEAGRDAGPARGGWRRAHAERKLFIDNLLVRIRFIIVMIRWTSLAPWEFESLFPGSLTSTFLDKEFRRDFLSRPLSTSLLQITSPLNVIYLDHAPSQGLPS